MSEVWARLRRVLGRGRTPDAWSASSSGAAPTGEPGAAGRSVAQARASVERRFMSMDGVVSVGVGRDQEGHEAIFVGIARERSKIAGALPQDVDGVPVVVEEVGELRAEGESP